MAVRHGLSNSLSSPTPRFCESITRAIKWIGHPATISQPTLCWGHPTSMNHGLFINVAGTRVDIPTKSHSDGIPGGRGSMVQSLCRKDCARKGPRPILPLLERGSCSLVSSLCRSSRGLPRTENGLSKTRVVKGKLDRCWVGNGKMESGRSWSAVYQGEMGFIKAIVWVMRS
jgi:hypothetical protein